LIKEFIYFFKCLFRLWGVFWGPWRKKRTEIRFWKLWGWQED